MNSKSLLATFHTYPSIYRTQNVARKPFAFHPTMNSHHRPRSAGSQSLRWMQLRASITEQLFVIETVRRTGRAVYSLLTMTPLLISS